MKQTYADLYASIVSNYQRDLKFVRSFLQSLKVDEPATVVDVGAGVGRCLAESAGTKWLAIENDVGMLTRLRKAAAAHPEVEVVEAHAFNLPLAANSADYTLFLNNSIAEMFPACFALAEAMRILKPGGRVLINVANPRRVDSVSAPSFSRSIESRDVTIRLDSFRTNSIDSKDFFTSISVSSDDDSESHYTVRQVLLNLSEWTDLLRSLGFVNIRVDDAESGSGSPEDSFVWALTASKPDVSLAPRVYQPELVAMYNELAPAYREAVKKVDYSVPCWLSQMASKHPVRNVRLLDLGCGEGLVPRVLIESGLRLSAFGIDVSDGMITQARAGGLYRGLMTVDLSSDLPVLPSCFFDLVTACGLFEFVPDPLSLLKWIHSSLRPDGEAWLTFELTNDSSSPKGVFDPTARSARWHYSRDEVSGLAEAAGFHLLDALCGVAYKRIIAGTPVEYVHAKLKRES